MIINTSELKWTRAPKQYTITEDKVEMITEPHTDLWQRTYYHFRNDNAPVLQMETEEQLTVQLNKTQNCVIKSTHLPDGGLLITYELK